MTATVPVRLSGSLQGIVLMTLAMLSISLVDGLAKHLSVSYSPLFISWARYAVVSLIVIPFAAVMHGWRLFPWNGGGPTRCGRLAVAAPDAE